MFKKTGQNQLNAIYDKHTETIIDLTIDDGLERDER